MRIHYLQHVPFENAANIAPWAASRKHQLSTTKLYAGQPLPDTNQFDWLIVMGGLMNIYQYDLYPWLLDEKKLIEQTIKEKKLLLGICLGAQLIADVAGAKVTANAGREIGFWPVTLTPQSHNSHNFRILPQQFTAFHWHGDTFSIPAGAIHLATSAGCSTQAFELDPGTLAIQFHLEYSQQSIEKMLLNCANEITSHTFVQPPSKIRQSYGLIEPMTSLLFQLLDCMALNHDQS